MCAGIYGIAVPAEGKGEVIKLVPLRLSPFTLAAVLAVPLVTADKAVLKAFPDRALTMETFTRT
jgi:hypothetical protein